MKKIISLLLLVSCSLLASKELLRLRARTLLIDPQGRGLFYPYNVYKCKYPNRWINKKCSWERREIIYDICKNKEDRGKLIENFVCIDRSRVGH